MFWILPNCYRKTIRLDFKYQCWALAKWLKVLGQVVSASKRNRNDFFNQINPAGFYFAHAKRVHWHSIRNVKQWRVTWSNSTLRVLAQIQDKRLCYKTNFQRIPRFLTFRAGKKIKNKKLSIYTSGYCQIPTSTGHVLEVKDLLL